MPKMYYIGLFILLLSCKQSVSEKADSCYLEVDDVYLTFPLDAETRVPYSEVSLYTDENGTDYLIFAQINTDVLIYNVSNGRLVKKIRYEKEGDNGVPGGVYGCFVKDFDHIYLYNPETTTLFVTDTTGAIRSTIAYDQTSLHEPLKGVDAGGVTLIGDDIYISQGVNYAYGEKVIEESRTGAVIKTSQDAISLLPMRFPPLVTEKDIHTSAAFGANFDRRYNGSHFVYSFFFYDSISWATPDHRTVEAFPAKSRYLNKVEVLRARSSASFRQIVKQQAEQAKYRNILYDPYREVYYRVAFLESELEETDNFIDLVRVGGKQFSILILDKDMQVIGETLFPPFTYTPRVAFVREDGLYLCASHFMHPLFNEDELTFQRVELIYY